MVQKLLFRQLLSLLHLRMIQLEVSEHGSVEFVQKHIIKIKTLLPLEQDFNLVFPPEMANIIIHFIKNSYERNIFTILLIINKH